MRQKQKKEYFLCSVYMKTRNVSYFLYNKAPNMENFQDLSEHLLRKGGKSIFSAWKFSLRSIVVTFHSEMKKKKDS